MGDDPSDELQRIAEEFDSEIKSNDTHSDFEENEEQNEQDNLSKNEIAEEFNVQFAKKPGNSVQHLVRPENDDTLCGIGLGSDVKRIDTPGPFDPICSTCRKSILGGVEGKRTIDDLRQWLADEIDEIRGIEEVKDSSFFNKSEIISIINYIKKLKKED